MNPFLYSIPVLFSLSVFAAPVWAQSVLEQLEQELQQSSGTLLHSVVSIVWEDVASRRPSLAVSGVVVDDQGSILTTGLPAQAENGSLRAVDHRGRDLKPKWLGFDPETGLTLLTVEPGRLAPAPFVDEVPEVGSWTILIGNPDGMRHSIRYGNISGAGREVQIQGRPHYDMIEFSSSLRQGDSGALLANRRGEMVGIVRSGLLRAGTTNRLEPRSGGIGFAIPVARARFVATQLRRHGRVQRGFLGIDADEPPAGVGQGAYVLNVYPGTPADKAGLKAGDLIVAIDGVPARSFADLFRTIQKSPPGTRLVFRVDRREDEVDLEVVLTERPTPLEVEGASPLPGLDPVRPPQSTRGVLLGVEVQALTPELRGALSLPEIDGAIVTEVTPQTPAAEAGLRTFDLIIAVDQKPVGSPDDLIDTLHEIGASGTTRLKILRDKQPISLDVVLGDQRDSAIPRRPYFPPDPRLAELQRRIEALERRVADLEQQLNPPEPQP